VLFMLIGIAIHATAAASLTTNGVGAQVQTDTGTGSGTQDNSAAGTLPDPPAFASDSQLTTYETSVGWIASAVYQDYSSGQVVAANMNWPKGIQVNADGKVLLPDGGTAAVIPAGEVVNIVVSDDGKYFVLFVSGGPKNETAIYDSKSNSYTWVCGAGAPASCPAGGVDPNVGGTSTSNS
jgi:hypothetical protein